MCHLGPIQPRHTLDRLRGRPTRIRHGLRSNVDCLSLSSSPSPPPASFPCRRPYSAPSLLRRRGQRAPRGCRPRAPVARAHAAAAPRARRGQSTCYTQLRELAARRPRLASPRLHCERPARARAEGAEGEEWRRRWGRLASPPLRDRGSRGGRMPAAMAPRRTGLTAELGCGRARAGGAQAGTARTAEEEGGGARSSRSSAPLREGGGRWWPCGS